MAKVPLSLNLFFLITHVLLQRVSDENENAAKRRKVVRLLRLQLMSLQKLTHSQARQINHDAEEKETVHNIFFDLFPSFS